MATGAPIVLKNTPSELSRKTGAQQAIDPFDPQEILHSPRIRSAVSGDQAPTSPVPFVASIQTQSVIDGLQDFGGRLRGRVNASVSQINAQVAVFRGEFRRFLRRLQGCLQEFEFR
jgi:hypothetical protein